MISDFLSSGIFGYQPEFLTREDIEYLEKFWIPIDQIEIKWKKLVDCTFDCSMDKIRIAPESTIDLTMGGCLFEEDDFLEFSARAAAVGAGSFAVIEALDAEDMQIEPKKFFRFSFPVDVSWQDLAHGAPIAEDVFQRPIRRFFVICDNGRAGKYVDNDADIPFHILFEKIPP